MMSCDTDFEIKAPRAATAVVLASLRHRNARWREEALHALTEGCERSPFLVITPRGRADRDLVAERLDHLGVSVVRREAIVNWPEVATSLAGRLADDAALLKAFGVEAAWDGLFESCEAERWDLASERDLALVLANERELRELVPSIYGHVACAGARVTVGLHGVYVPRTGTWALESAVCDVATGRIHRAVAC